LETRHKKVSGFTFHVSRKKREYIRTERVPHVKRET